MKPNGFAFLVVISSVFVVDGACDKSDKFLPDRVSHEVAYVHDRSVILSAEPLFSDAFLFSSDVSFVATRNILSCAEVLP